MFEKSDIIDPTLIYPSTTTSEVTLSQNNVHLVLTNSSSVQTIIIDESVDEQIAINYTSSIIGNTVTITNGYDILFHTPHASSVQDDDGIITISNNTTLTGPIGWNGILKLPTTTLVTIPQETTTTTTNGVITTTTITYSEIAAFEIGLDGSTVQLSNPARIEFTGDGGNGFATFFVDPSGIITFINTECSSDSALGLTTTGANECFIDNNGDLIVWTEHFTKFGASKKSTSSSSTGGTTGGTTGGIAGGGGKTGVGPGGSGGGLSGFGGILHTPLTINEISYDKCDEHIARILISSDADDPPSVVLHTAKSGTVSAKLADVQPYEESNKITKIDKYLYEISIDPEESFLMVVVTEVKGTLKNTVQAAVQLLSCEGTTVIAKVPKEEFREPSFNVPRIFDTKFQIDNGTKHRADLESEFFYVDEQNLGVTAIIDSKTALDRVELRLIVMGQPDEEYTAIKMNVETLPISNSTYLVSATIPSYLMVEPAMKYWIHVRDGELNTNESKHFSIGVKPTTIPDVSVEMDVPSIRPSGSVIRPEIYIKNQDTQSYGIVSLMVNGEVVSKRSQLFEVGQTKVTFDWNIPASKSYTSNELQGKVDLYDKSTTTKSALVHSYPQTISMAASDMKSLELLEKDGKVLASPALIYSSNSDENLRFKIMDPLGQCIIGASDDCIVNESTKDNRGGLVSVNYVDQILRVRYSGSDNPLERFSITSIDPLVDNWIVTLETSDGVISPAHAIQDTPIKIKYRYHSETITVRSE